MTLSPPQPLSGNHEAADFNCDRATSNDWLKHRALRSQSTGAYRSFVVCDQHRVIAYYALASGAVTIGAASGRLRRNMPDPVPVLILARLAVEQTYGGRGLGRALLQDAGWRVLNAAETIGIRGMLVHALDEDARAFYQHLGFDQAPLEPATLMITLEDLRARLSG